MASENENGADQDVELLTKLMTLAYASSTTTILHDFSHSTQGAFSTTERINRLGLQGEEECERGLGVSIPLRLYDYEDPWKIKKTLSNTDINHSSRLLVPINLVQDHILPFFDVNELEGDGLRVKIWDHDTRSEHQMTFKRWKSSNSYIFNGKWSKEFVRRRNLVKGDQIGLFWNPYNSRFHLSVLNRALPHSNGASRTVN